MRKLDRNGFTIIELLIATVVFSVVLLVVTTGIVQFGKIYYKGVIQSRTQERARSIIEDISQNLQFSGSEISGTKGTNGGYYCVGGRRFTFQFNVQQSATQRVLIADNTSCSASFTPPSTWTWPTGQELAGDKMQLLDLDITKSTGGADLYTITVRLAYGSSSDMTGTPKTCNAIKLGGQFCAVSELKTTVSRRLK
jgi:prepilin-type N-terminal cleavage/methylation domain-containing protein